ncbi:hypothetical protein OIU74_021465 [Salix koriyanagi]|uniref:Apple domain-containing protein n=1 Tax=Salix koriyanagi TaxID=2511006 RepID=A0A9Q0WIP0_9ROSI|nr:hypothetical protein OIU74_021465 [Salix koriyanagi]
MALYANFKDGKTQQMYWKHKALEAKAEVVQGQGPIHARLESDGFLGMYQIGKTPVDIQPFNSFHRPIDTFLVLRLEPDGNLKGYYWAQTDWTRARVAPVWITGPRWTQGSFQCIDGDDQSGDFCSGSDDFWAIRRKGVELPFKELMGSDTKSSSVEECELSCHGNCSCWGAVYNNVTGFCYLVDYPIQTLVGVGDESKIGYFKVRATRDGHKKMKAGIRVIGVVILALTGAVIGYAGYKIWNRRRAWPKRVLEENAEVSPGPYKNLGSASFKSIEML